MGKFIISQRTNGQYYFSLKASNGQTILVSEGYSSKAGCLNGIQSVKTNSRDDSRFDRKTTNNGKPYFILKATNGQIIGVSEVYESSAARDNGIDIVKVNAFDAIIDDKSI
ncbi:YegP family protein [Flavobacterium tructae]|uniref:YegP family protein n=1 Tax=Flavobacterium tructae TaxID=1114873 RepID=UPI002551E891|nr:YegP family protein [Flavobacterium tructae]MDL2141191.1 YegP family protein [Flavobacterium tructae]